MQLPASAAKVPASTVEPVTETSGARSGMTANVDTRTSEDRSAQAMAQIRTSSVSSTAVLALTQVDTDPIDQDAPTGPPPTFEVTPLEARVAELTAPPDMTADLSSVPTGTSVEAAYSAPTVEASPISATRAGDDTRAVAAPATVLQSANNQTGWQSMDTAAQGQSLDLLR
ncbi:MAG TPA: hypothetical protein VGC31_06700 [Paenirhodobacter sp.]